QAVALVLLGVDLAAGTEVREVEQPEREGEHLLAAHAGLRELARDAAPGGGQAPADVEHVVVLAPRTAHLPLLVVQVLAPTGDVAPERLDVPVRVPADPDVGPGGRDREARA